MAINPSDFNISSTPNPIKAVVGNVASFDVNFSNSNATDTAYNLSVTINIPDGTSFVSSSIDPDLVVINPDDTITINWLNIKDLAPNESYSFSVTLMADETFRETGLPVTFDVPLSDIDILAKVDTLPRGNDDVGNVEIIKNIQDVFIPLRYDLIKSAPNKIPKGAGTPSSPRWVYTYTLTVLNNSREPTIVTLIDNLPNGVRYLGNLQVVGPDAVALSSPNVITPSPGIGCQDFVIIDWGAVTLSPNSTNTITFDAAVWDNYTENCIENSGARIPHNTSLLNVATLDGPSGPLEKETITRAMDATINKSVASNQTDVGVVNNYTLVYRINQYDDVSDFTIIDVIGNGETYNPGSASIAPDSIVVNVDGTTTLTWDLGLQSTGTEVTITFSTTVDNSFVPLDPVSSGDTLTNEVSIDGTTPFGTTPDNSGASTSVRIPSITKEILGYFYKDGTPKSFDVVAPGDKVRFKITYDAIGIEAAQKNIQIDEFAPDQMGPLTDTLPVTFGGSIAIVPPVVTISPNGLRWSLGTITESGDFTLTFDVPVANVDFVGSRNNLGKLSGENTQDIGYSDRSQVLVKFGKPNIEFEKTVSGPDVNAIRAGEVYTYSITISNPQNDEGNVTDAFEMDLTDVIPNGLTYNGNFNVVGTGTYDPPSFIGQNVSMTIKKLAPDESLTFTFEVEVDSDIVAGQSFTNSAVLQSPYSQPDRSYQFPEGPFMASTTLNAEAIVIDKLISPDTVKIGDIVSYILQVTVPIGTTAYNIDVVDTFPVLTQDYVGNATIDGLPVAPAVVGGTVTFPTIPFVDATLAAVTLTFSFDVRVVDGETDSPYVDNQQDDVTVNWDIDAIGTPAIPVSTSENLLVKVPHLTAVKEQRNVTRNNAFTTQRRQYDVGDIIEYRITLRNIGEISAFDVELTDIIDPILSFVPGSIQTTLGIASEAGGTITWNIASIVEQGTAVLTFRVVTLPGVPASGLVPNQATIIYNSNNNGFGMEFKPVVTNIVELRAEALTIEKEASILEGEIGDDITYTITVTVPEGVIAYTPQIIDTLPVGQTYQIGSATLELPPNPPVPVVPNVVGQTITFPQLADIDASLGEVKVIYTFTARITSANTNPPYTQQQTDEGRVRWAIVSGGALVRDERVDLTITVNTPHIDILKEQRNFTRGGSYTTNSIEALPGEIVYYRFTATSNGASPAYQFDLEDILDSNISYVSVVSQTHGSVSVVGNTLNWEIAQLNDGDIAVLEISVIINNGVGAGNILPNTSSVTYDSNDVNPDTYIANSNTVFITIPLVSIEKDSSIDIAAIGDTITYEITIDIPAGVRAYDIIIKDLLPTNQSYVPGSWSPGIVVVNGNELTFTDGAAFREGPYNQVYTFDAIVTGGTITAPYTEIQTNVANVLWNVTPLGPQRTNVASKDIEVNVPHITAEKRQRNATKGGAFTKLALTNVDVGDIIEYEITITNDGENTAYDIVTIDNLDLAFTFNSLISIPPGVITTPVGPGGQVRWELNPPDSLAIGASLTLIFAVEVNVGFSPGDAIVNQSSTEYESADTPDSITLGPSLSNQVTLNLTLPVITKSVNKQTFFVGDTAMYMVEFVIPEGGIVYDVQVRDLLPATQTYVVGSLYKQVNANPPVQINPIQILPELIFENPTDIDASLEEITIRYFFEATIDSVVNTPEDIQTNTSTIYWNEQSGSDPGTPQSDSVDIYVTNTIPLTEKSQRNFTTGGAFTILPVNAAVGDIIYYRYEVTNNSANTIYNVVIEDVLDQFIQTVGPVSIPPTGVFLQTGNTIKITITEIAALDTVTAIVAYTVIQGIGTEGIIPNSFTTTYDVNNTAPNLQYGPIDSNEVQLRLPPLAVEKRVDLETVEIGQIIEYFIDVTVPNGTIAYNVEVVDTLPVGQIYVGEAAIDGVQTFPGISGQVVTFAPIDIDATSGEKTVVFSFKARVVTGELEAPYTEIQTNNVEVNYDIDDLGNEGTPQNASKDVTVNSPNVFIAKSQRNVTKDTGYTTDVINVEVGDVLEFKLVVHNLGLADAYNVIITDALGLFYEFISIEAVSLGNAIYNMGTNTIIWSIDTLPIGSVETLIFRVRLKGGVSAGGIDDNIANGIYDTNPVTPITLGPLLSNEVIQRYPNIRLSKTSDIEYAVIGDIITYTVEFTLPKGTVIYNGQFTDVIPIGQQYNDNATLNGNPIIAQVNGQSVAFPSVPFAQAGAEDLVFVYTFETKVISANPDNITLVEVQTNNAQGNWGLTPEIPATPVNAADEIIVTDSLIGIEKLQRNVTQGGSFTDLNIEGFTEEIVEYKLIVTNTGPNTVYDVEITDDLPQELDFIQTISVDKGSITELPNNFITWNIPTLLTGETAEAVISLEIISTEEKTIENTAIGKFRVTLINPNYFGNIPSNTVEIDLLGPPFSFLPVLENRESDTEAISYGVVGCAGKVGYELLSESSQPTSYMLSIDPLIVDYDIYINNVFVTTVSKNTPYSDTPNQLKDLLQGDSRLIELRYYTPEDIVPGTIDTFNITASASTSKTISTDILFGAVDIKLMYKTFVYSNSYDVVYTIIVNVLENIKVYDFNLVSIFSNVFTFEDATLDGNPIVPVVNNNMITFPNISEIEGPETLVYQYRVKTKNMNDVSTGYARIVEAYGLLKTSETFEDRCRINAKFINTIKNECIIADKVYSQCQKRVCLGNIPLNTPKRYSYDSICFENGNIIPDTLKIESIDGRINFKRVTFDVCIPYQVTFKDNKGNTIVKHRILPIYNIDVVLYMPDTRDEIEFKIILDTLSELLYVDKENDTITVGVFNKISVVLRVQLFIPAFDYCDIPPICEEYNQCIFEGWLDQ